MKSLICLIGLLGVVLSADVNCTTNVTTKILVNNVTNSKDTWFIVFYAGWSKPSEALLPLWKNVSIKYCDAPATKLGLINIDTDIDLKYRFDINTIPTLMVVKGSKYSTYDVTNKTEEELSVFIKENKHVGHVYEIPPAKTSFEIVKLQTRDNLIGLSKMADFFGLKDLRIRHKIMFSVGVLLLPVIIALIYVALKSKKETETKTKAS